MLENQGNERRGRVSCRHDRVFLPISRPPKVLILASPEKEHADSLAERIVAHLRTKEVELLGVLKNDGYEALESKPDLVVVLGGDGAMLAACHRLGARQVPVLGVNLGRIGFLTAVAPDRALRVLDEVLGGTGHCEAHAMIHPMVRRGSEVLLDTHVLNEVVVQRTWSSTLLEVDLLVDRRLVCQFRADGLIVATATGSTAYSLSAGGPVLSPRLDAWVVTPLAPYSLNQRPLVLPGNRSGRLIVHTESGFQADGHDELRLHPGDEIRLTPSNRTFHLVVDQRANFFARLRSKLLWGESPGPGI